MNSLSLEVRSIFQNSVAPSASQVKYSQALDGRRPKRNSPFVFFPIIKAHPFFSMDELPDYFRAPSLE